MFCDVHVLFTKNVYHPSIGNFHPDAQVRELTFLLRSQGHALGTVNKLISTTGSMLLSLALHPWGVSLLSQSCGCHHCCFSYCCCPSSGHSFEVFRVSDCSINSYVYKVYSCYHCLLWMQTWAHVCIIIWFFPLLIHMLHCSIGLYLQSINTKSENY